MAPQITYTIEMDFAILEAVVKYSDATAPRELFVKIAEKFSASAGGCRQRFYKLKAEAEELLPKPDDADATATPAVKKRGRTKKSDSATPKSSAKGRKRNVEVDAHDDADEAVETPSKKAKTTTVKATTDAVDEAPAVSKNASK